MSLVHCHVASSTTKKGSLDAGCCCQVPTLPEQMTGPQQTDRAQHFVIQIGGAMAHLVGGGIAKTRSLRPQGFSFVINFFLCHSPVAFPRMTDQWQGWWPTGNRGNRGSGHAYQRFLARQAQKGGEAQHKTAQQGAWSSEWPPEQKEQQQQQDTWGEAPWSSSRRSDTPPPNVRAKEEEQPSYGGGTGDTGAMAKPSLGVDPPRRFAAVQKVIV